MNLRPTFDAIPSVKVLFNIGACFDIPTGTYIRGFHGESLLNGGLGALTGFTGIGNNFKSTLLNYQMLTAAARMSVVTKSTYVNTYDTEINIHEWHLRHFMERIRELDGRDMIDLGEWVITDKTVYLADEWFDKAKEYIQSKRKSAGKISRKTPFKNRDCNGYLEILEPTYTAVDSLSEFMTQDVVKMQDENSLGDSGANTLSMRQGLQKNRFLMEIPVLAQGGYNYTLMTAHLGDAFEMDPKNPKPKKLQHLKEGQKLKGVPEKFTFLMSNCWWSYNARPLINDGTKAPEYPRDGDDDLKMDTDLNVVTVRQLRSKSGPTGMIIELIVSQQEGVLPELTEFHYIKGRERFGFEGNMQNYSLALLPDVSLSRTKIRGKIEENPKLRRALNITSELCQMTELWHNLDDGILCTPKELYDDLKAAGYDWDILLNTRGWWTLDNDEYEVPFLSTMDLLRMRKGLYHPYWLKEDKKTLLTKAELKKLTEKAIEKSSKEKAAEVAAQLAKIGK